MNLIVLRSYAQLSFYTTTEEERTKEEERRLRRKRGEETKEEERRGRGRVTQERLPHSLPQAVAKMDDPRYLMNANIRQR